MASEVLEKRFFFTKVFNRKRKRSSSNAGEDSDIVLPGLRREQMPKHRSCVVHLLTFKHGQQATRKQAEQIKDKYGTARCFFNSIPHGIRSRKSKRADLVAFTATNMSSDPVSLQSANKSSDPVPFQVKDSSSNPAPFQPTDRSSDPVPFEARNVSSDPVPFQAANTSFVPAPFGATNMSSSKFGDHLERLWRSFSADVLVQFTYLECLWFGMYRKASHRSKVLSWIKRKNIFSRNYVFVPICCWGHWNLLILCHFGESLDSENKEPCMLLLDSLHMADPMRLEREIRKFVLDIYKEEGISDRRVSKIRLLVPKVPQQRNKECGFFSLYFMKKFIEAAPETISVGDISFIGKNWFTREELDGFCIALEKEAKAQSELEAMTSQEMLLHESWRDGDVIVIKD